MRVMQILSRATNVISEGEVQQLINVRNPDTTEPEYMQIITRKTAMLFQAAAHSGAVLAGADEKTETALKNFGLHLGIAFQLVDDYLDYNGSTDSLGKNVGDDLAEGKVTLPLIAALRSSESEHRKFISDAIRSGGAENLPEMLEVVKASGALDYTSDAANQQRCQGLEALGCVDASIYKDSMTHLINFAVDRSH